MICFVFNLSTAALLILCYCFVPFLSIQVQRQIIGFACSNAERVQWGYTRGTVGVRWGYMRGTVEVQEGYSRGTVVVQEGYSGGGGVGVDGGVSGGGCVSKGGRYRYC